MRLRACFRAASERSAALAAAAAPAASGPSCKFGWFANVGANSGTWIPSTPGAVLRNCTLPALGMVRIVVAACAAAMAPLLQAAARNNLIQ